MRKKGQAWTRGCIVDCAKQVNGRREFNIKFPGAYSAARRMQIMEELFGYKMKTGPKKFWTESKIRETASKFKTKIEFRNAYRGGYDTAFALGILDDLGFETIGSNHKRCIYAIEFEDNHVYVGLTFNLKKRIISHFSSNKKSTPRKYFEESNVNYKVIKCTEYIDKAKASKKEGEILNDYKTNGWFILNKAKTGGLGGGESDLSNEEIIETAINYKNASEFEKSNDKHMYRAACYRKILNDLKYSDIKLNKNLSIQLAKKYFNATEFQNSIDKSSYHYAVRNSFHKELVYKYKKGRKEFAIEASLKYKNATEYQKSIDKNLYWYAVRQKFLREFKYKD